MKTPLPTRFSFHLFAALLLPAVVVVPQAHAAGQAEGPGFPDFPNNAPGPAYPLTNVGVYTFSGTVTGTTDIQDRFQVTAATGFMITQVTKNVTGDPNPQGLFIEFNFQQDLLGLGPGTFSVPNPLRGGPCNFLVNANGSTGNNWTVSITVVGDPDYAITTDDQSIVVTDLKGNSDTLNVTNSSFGNIKLTAAGRYFSVNGAPPILGSSDELFYFGLSNIVVNAGGGDDVINLNLGEISGSYPSVTINGGKGDDTVNLNSSVFLAPGRSLDIDLQDDDAAPGEDSINVAPNVIVATSGSGAITLRCSRNVALAAGSNLRVADGDITVAANQQATSTSGNFIGVDLDAATMKSTGAGYVIVSGRGGDDPGGSQLGVRVIDGAKIIGGTSGYVIVNGTGGASTNYINRGVTVYGDGSAITSSNGSVYVTGNAGPVGGFFGIGVSVLYGGEISAGGIGRVNITGNGAGAIGSGFNQGLELSEAGSRIAASGGSIEIDGSAGPGASFGIYLANSGVISASGVDGGVDLLSDSVSLDETASITSTNSSGFVEIIPQTYGTTIALGGADGVGTLGLTDAELNRMSTPTLIIGLGNCPINIVAPITHATATNLTLLPGAGGGVVPTTSGMDISLATAGVVKIPFGSLVCAINGPAPDSGYAQFNIAGKVNLSGTTLVISGSYSGAIGDSFTIVNNDGTDPVVGTFNGLPEGAFLSLNGQPAQIHYAGGTGNDVVLVRTRTGLTATRSGANGAWRFTGIGSSNGIYSVQATTNFITWTNIGSATGSVSGAFSFTDTNAFHFPRRFYRTTD